jgi:hypothetical protein
MQPADWRAGMQRLVEERDRLADPTHSGPPAEWCKWVDGVQMPALASRPQYQRQFSDRITELEMKLANLEQQIANGRHDLEPAAGICRREIVWITELTAVPHG